MGKFYQISYDIRSIDNNELIKDRIKQFGDFCNIFPGTWLIYKDLSVQEIYQKISNEQFEEISMIVLMMDDSAYWGRMDKSIWDWLKHKR